MNQKGFINIILIIIVIALVGTGAYFVSTGQVTLPTPSPTPTSTSKPSPTFESSSIPTTTIPFIGDDTYSWPIQNVCIPVSSPGDPVVIKDLRDGTYVYQRSDGSLFRGNQNSCRCLSAQTLISTPNGSKIVKDLKIGMYVYTLNRRGDKIIAPLTKTAKVSIPSDYMVSYILLSDNRELFASNAHPTADGRTIGELFAGDSLGGAQIIKRELVLYSDSFTYDILPAGDTGFYWANDIILKSTLSK